MTLASPPADAADSPSPSFALPAGPRGPEERMSVVSSIPFWLVHAVPLLAIFTGVTWTAVILLIVTFWTRMFFITGGYHRYFAHKSYKLNRFWQLVMAVGGATAAQKGPLWWAGNHRHHHTWADTDQDVHSPLRGFWWSHMGWILCPKYNETPIDRIKDFAEYPELRWLNKYDFVPPWALALACLAIGGWSGLLIGFFLSTVLLWHSTFLVNSLAHVMGRRRYATEDTSKNSALIAIVTMGEGWHNNHHYYQASARQGFFWWEWDPTYYVLRTLSLVGIVKDLKTPPERVKATNRVREGAFDVGMFRAHWSRAATAVAATRSSVSDAYLGRRADATESLLHAREAVEDRAHAVEEAVGARREALEQLWVSSLESAEELARASRSVQRELGTAER